MEYIDAALSSMGRSAAARQPFAPELGCKRKAPEATPGNAKAALSADWPPHQSYVSKTMRVRSALSAAPTAVSLCPLCVRSVFALFPLYVRSVFAPCPPCVRSFQCPLCVRALSALCLLI